LHLRREAHDLARDNTTLQFMNPFQLSVTVSMMDHIARQWQAELEWVCLVREQLLSSIHND
jgi:hypothetical protein